MNKVFQLYILKKKKAEIEMKIEELQNEVINEFVEEKRIPIDSIKYFTVIDSYSHTIATPRLIQSIGQPQYNKVSKASKSAIEKNLGKAKVKDLTKKGIIETKFTGKYLRLIEPKEK